MSSAWPDPGFTGIKLPDSREVTDSGFTAKWNI
ncbi:MAG: inner membrane CreD family protein [Chitinophagaceae bacterium]|nr:inner membrane CreD family protein [Chitinophagaceae bacterium]